MATPNPKGRVLDLQAGGGRHHRRILSPPTIPSDPQTLAALQHQANSRFLTDCYLFPAALLSTRCPKIEQVGGRRPRQRPKPPRRCTAATARIAPGLFRNFNWNQ
jgi:hypothetical protein